MTWILARRLTSWHIKGCYPSCRRTEFEASCIFERLVFLQIANNVVSSVTNHHNGFQCHQVYRKVQCWAHCCSWYTSTTSQTISHLSADYLMTTVCCTAPLNHCKTANFCNRILIDLSEKWLMKFNVHKCTSMSVHQLQSRFQNFTYKMNNNALTQMDEKKYLGVMLTSDLKWNTHIWNRAAKANR